jgi:hypothetical protein
MKHIILALSLACCAAAAPVKLVEESPVSVTEPAPGIVLIDFGKVSFGNIEITPPSGATGDFKVHFGEAFADGRINRKPPGTVRYSMAAGNGRAGKRWSWGRPPTRGTRSRVMALIRPPS